MPPAPIARRTPLVAFGGLLRGVLLARPKATAFGAGAPDTLQPLLGAVTVVRVELVGTLAHQFRPPTPAQHKTKRIQSTDVEVEEIKTGSATWSACQAFLVSVSTHFTSVLGVRVHALQVF